MYIENILEKKNLVLIITHLYENYDTPKTHYSGIKGYLLADGLIEHNYIPLFLTNIVMDDIIKKDKYYYINYKLLTPLTLSKFVMIISVLHNKETLTPIIRNTNIIYDIINAKKINPKLDYTAKLIMI